MSILSLLIGLIVILVVFWAVQRLLAAFGVGEPIATIVYVLLVVLVLLWILSTFGWIGGPVLRLR